LGEIKADMIRAAGSLDFDGALAFVPNRIRNPPVVKVLSPASKRDPRKLANTSPLERFFGRGFSALAPLLLIRVPISLVSRVWTVPALRKRISSRLDFNAFSLDRRGDRFVFRFDGKIAFRVSREICSFRKIRCARVSVVRRVSRKFGRLDRFKSFFG
jgi:hypothetical protein